MSATIDPSCWRMACLTAILAMGLGARVAGSEPVDFKSQVVPILKANCVKCHSGPQPKSGFRITSRQGLLAGGDYGPAIDADDLLDSTLLKAINYDELEMPPAGKLGEREIDILSQWVKAGAAFPHAIAVPPAGDELATSPSYEAPPPPDSAQARSWWAYQPIRRPLVPRVENRGWISNPIDAFILARLETEGLEPAKSCQPLRLVRRAHYDLLGLPPTPDDLRRFAAIDSPEEFSAFVEALLARPQYGEKWARHWLDVVRYAETNGYERDGDKENAWRYRDYVIRAFNNDKPYDRFVEEQIAGDEMFPDNDDALVATAFQRLGLWDDEPVDADAAFFDTLDDVVSTSSQAFLGMTIGCARCHDHKIDSIPQSDYYSMVAFFRNTLCDIRRGEFEDFAFTLNTQRPLAGPSAEVTAYEARLRESAADLAQRKAAAHFIDAQLWQSLLASGARAHSASPYVLLNRFRPRALPPDQIERLGAWRYEANHISPPPPPSTLCIQENGATAPPTYVLVRGNVHAPGAEVQPHFPTVLGGVIDPVPAIFQPTADSCGRRTALARWITDPSNPLTARVMVNRIWQHHFGRGIVNTPNDFGHAGAQPTHPELLDWLAAEFIDCGWSIKHMHRLILNCSAYRMSAAPGASSLARDPQNRLFGHFNARRLTAEELHDSILSVTGQLNPKMGGPSTYPSLPTEVLAGASRPEAAWGHSSPAEQRRRSIYVKVRRSVRPPLMSLFDAADTDASCAARFATTVPTQALTLINSEFMARQAEVLAKRLQREAPTSAADQIRFVYRLTTAREPTADEIERDIAFLDELQRDFRLTPDESLERYCLAAMNANEFLYLD